MVKAMTDWSVDLTTSFEAGDADKGARPSPEPDSSSTSELGDFELNYLHQIYQSPEDFTPCDEDFLLYDEAKPAPQSISEEAESPQEAAWLQTTISLSDFTDGNEAPAAEESKGADKPAATVPSNASTTAAVHERAAIPSTLPVQSQPYLYNLNASKKRKEPERLPALLKRPEPTTAEVNQANEILASLGGRDPGSLTPDEQKLLKKQKRLIKNRESAQLSRQRKKNHLEALEMQVQQLEKERAALTLRMEHLVEENAFLKKQLMGQGRLPPAPAQASTLPATPLTVKPIQASSSKTSKGSIALAVVLFAGMCFTSVDIVQERLPQLYVPRSSAVEFSSIPYPDSEHGRKGGRVLLSVAADDETRSAYSLDRKQLLIVTLLDHLVGQIQAPASLFSRLCYKLVDMEVLSSCDFLPDIDTVRHRYLAEFKELNEEFVKDKDEVHVDAEFTFSTSSNALTKSIDAVPTRFRTMPLPGSPSSNALRELLKSKAASTFRSDFNVLCPEAQLLIADKPANDMSVSARLIRKQSKPLSPPPRNGTAEEVKTEQIAPKEDGRMFSALSMILPRNVLDSQNFAEYLPKQLSPLVEVQCSSFNLHPLFPNSISLSGA
uniref:BZIP domain-containing protein n=1 Tax=Hanusia phi TaxID=3032 RepID=A0A7S0HUF6_9CRYP